MFFSNRYKHNPVPYLIIIVVSIVISAVALSGVIVRHNRGGSLSLDPTDTRLVSLSRPFCQTLNIRVSRGSDDGYIVSLYSLSSPPTLTGRETFSMVNKEPGLSPPPTYRYYLHEKSNFTVSACIKNPKDLDPLMAYYIIKGNNSYSLWKKNKAHHFEYRRNITSLCASGNTTHSYTVQSEDAYYLVFYSYYTFGSAVNISMYFERTRYEVSNGTVRQECRVTSSTPPELPTSCGVGLPLSGTSNLLAVEPEGYTDRWTDTVSLNFNCSARIWMYAIICLCILIGITAILVVFSFFIDWLGKCLKVKKQISYSVDGSGHYSVNDPLVKESSTHKSASSGYGSNSRKY